MSLSLALPQAGVASQAGHAGTREGKEGPSRIMEQPGQLPQSQGMLDVVSPDITASALRTGAWPAGPGLDSSSCCEHLAS